MSPPRLRTPFRRARWLVAAVLGATLGASTAAAAASGTISTVAGTGTGGFGGDGGAATAALLDGPRGVAWTAAGGFLVADNLNNRVRLVSPAGTITTVAGTGEPCPTGGADPCGDGGQATAARLNFLHGVAVTSDGGFLIADTRSRRIRHVSGAGVITTVAGDGKNGFGGDGGPAVSARISDVRGIAALPDGGFLIADTDNRRVRRVGPDGVITTVAGNGAGRSAGDGGLAVNASLNLPFGVSPTADGGFLIADAGAGRVRKVLSDGTIRTVAGNGSLGFSGDGGPARLARITPTAVAATPDGGFLIADSAADHVRYVSPGGVISTVAGSGADTSAGDGGLATQAGVNGPRGLAVRADGRFLIAEYDGDRVRFVDFAPARDPVAKKPPRRTGAGNRKPTDRRRPTTAKRLTLRMRRRMRARPRRAFRVRYWASAEANVTLKVFKKREGVRRVRRHARAGRNRIKVRRGLRAGSYVLRLSARGPDRKLVRARARLIVRRP
jgi:hypothetical protein